MLAETVPPNMTSSDNSNLPYQDQTYQQTSYYQYTTSPPTNSEAQTTHQYSTTPYLYHPHQQSIQYQTDNEYVYNPQQYDQLIKQTTQYPNQSITAATRSSSYAAAGGMRSSSVATETSRVIGHETGAERLVSVVSRVDESRAHIVSERYVEHEVKVPKKIIREEIIEKIIVVPERIVHEEIIEETQKIREKVVEIARPTIIEKVVEVPETTWVEKIVEVAEIIQQEKLVYVDKVIEEERIVEVPKTVYQDKVTYVDDIQYRPVPVERVVEIPDYREEVIVKEVKVPQHVPKPIPVEVHEETIIDIERSIPVPVEAVVAYEYRMPRIKPRYRKVTYPVYLPKFIEVPVAAELLNAGLLATAETHLALLQQLTRAAPSLCDIENLVAHIVKSDIAGHLQSVDLQQAVLKAWESNSMMINSTGATQYAQTTQLRQSAFAA